LNGEKKENRRLILEWFKKMNARLHASGSYVLLIKLSDPTEIQVGALGKLELQRGWLFYVGSAFGAGGIAGRLKHHLQPSRRPRWHIDYVRLHAPLMGVWFANGQRNLEHQWAATLRGHAALSEPMQGFGASDCRCHTHLFFASLKCHSEDIVNVLQSRRTSCAVDFLSQDQLHL
ncbi:MAG TPA: hypothetical protein DCZ03_12760, partial [Gammaproteobacteria bacterium]|nr:hypothetical protein [Gammaproteobacteria bacterium]